MRFRRMIVSVFAFLMVATLIPATASAQDPTIGGFRLRVEELGTGTGPGVVIKDEVNEELFGELGVINIFATFGNIIVDSTQGFSKGSDQVSSTLPAEMKVTSLNVSSRTGTTVRLTLEDTDFAGQTSASLRLQNSISVIALSAGATITTQAWIAALPPDLGYLQDAPGPLQVMPTIQDAGAMVMDSTTGSEGEKVAYFSATGQPYALFTQILIVFGVGGGEVTFNQDTTVTLSNQALEQPTETPEPASLLLIGTGVVGLAAKMRRRKSTRV